LRLSAITFDANEGDKLMHRNVLKKK